MNVLFPKDLPLSVLEGKTVLLPTDTVYGLAVSPINKDAIDKIYAIKQRHRDFNLSIMVASTDEFDELGVDKNIYIRRLLSSPYIPGPITLIVGFKTIPIPAWLSGREEIAIRIPNNDQLISLIKNTGPLLVTSANRHKLPVPNNICDILEQLEGQPDVIIDGGFLESISSTIVNCRHSPPTIEREGLISKKELLKWIQ
jgi:L-threonylcarbamoyladenylate synthase